MAKLPWVSTQLIEDVRPIFENTSVIAMWGKDGELLICGNRNIWERLNSKPLQVKNKRNITTDFIKLSNLRNKFYSVMSNEEHYYKMRNICISNYLVISIKIIRISKKVEMQS